MFHKPKWLWPIAEHQIRKVAGIGKIDINGTHRNRRYEKHYKFPDVCVVGGGPAGIAAACGALKEGKRTVKLKASVADNIGIPKFPNTNIAAEIAKPLSDIADTFRKTALDILVINDKVIYK